MNGWRLAGMEGLVATISAAVAAAAWYVCFDAGGWVPRLAWHAVPDGDVHLQHHFATARCAYAATPCLCDLTSNRLLSMRSDLYRLQCNSTPSVPGKALQLDCTLPSPETPHSCPAHLFRQPKEPHCQSAGAATACLSSLLPALDVSRRDCTALDFDTLQLSILLPYSSWLRCRSSRPATSTTAQPTTQSRPRASRSGGRAGDAYWHRHGGQRRYRDGVAGNLRRHQALPQAHSGLGRR